VALTVAAAVLAVAAVSAGTVGYLRRAATHVERGLAVVGGLLLLTYRGGPMAAGVVCLAAALALHRRGR
jgi:TRAP-type uncharacterized transport system fused permease subunit